MKYIILISFILILLILPVNGFNISDKNSTILSFNLSLVNNTERHPDINDNLWHVNNPRYQDRYLSMVGYNINVMSPYLPLMELNVSGVYDNLKLDKSIIENADKNFNGTVNYLRRYNTSYGSNETLIYGDMDTGEVIGKVTGDYGYVYAGIIPNRTNMIVIHTHTDPIPGVGKIYNPIFSYGDKAAFNDDYNAGIRWEGVITSNGIIITNINPSNISTTSSGYTSGLNFLDQFTQKLDFEKEGMHIQTYKWLLV